MQKLLDFSSRQELKKYKDVEFFYDHIMSEMLHCSPNSVYFRERRERRDLDKYDISENIKEAYNEIRNFNKVQEKECSIIKQTYEVVRPTFDEIIEKKSVSDSLYYFSYYGWGEEPELYNIGLFQKKKDCEKYNKTFVKELKYETLKCKKFNEYREEVIPEYLLKKEELRSLQKD